MVLLWPGFIFLLVLIPLIILAYVWILRRRRRFAVRYSSLSLIRAAIPKTAWLRRHLPFTLFLLGLAGLIMAMTRPVAIVSVPTNQTTIILALDVSRSMCSNDIPPNRLEAAKDAALSFVQSQPAGTQVGIVAFAGFAQLVLSPTDDQAMLEEAIEHLTTNRRTAIGSAILESLAAIADTDSTIAPVMDDSTPGPMPTAVPKGAYAPAIIVLLTDGASNRGPYPLEAAQHAVDRGVRVFTIGFGTAQGGVMDCTISGDPFSGSGFFGGGGRPRRGIDEETLQRIADMSDGAYYAPESAGELQEVFENLPTHLVTRHKTSEISVAFVALSVLFFGTALLLAMVWHPLLY